MLDHELFLLEIITITLMGLLATLLVYLMIRKAFDIKNRRIIESYKEKYNPFLFTMLSDGGFSREVNPETALQLKAIEELLNRYANVLEGEEAEKRLSELATLYLTDYYQKRLKSLRWSQRMNALYHIEDLKIYNLQQGVYELVEKRESSHEEIVHGLRILGLFQYKKIYELLTTRFSGLSENEYRNILIRLEKSQFDLFVLGFHKNNLPLKKAILAVISIKKELSYLSFTEDAFSDYSGEIKLRALKALAVIGYVKDIEPYMKLLYSPKWQERMFAARLIGAIREETGIPRLTELLHDETWWVRSQAGQAIYQFPNGKGILEQVLETSTDAYAKDMAWEWLHKGV